MSGPPAASADMWFGYKFVGDNIDKNVKPRFQRQGGHTSYWAVSTLLPWLCCS